MKSISKIILVLCVIFMASGMMAQDKLIGIIDSFSDLDNIEYVKVNAADIDVGEDTDDHIMYILDKLETIRVLEIEKNRKAADEMYKKASKVLKDNPYIEFMSVKTADENVNMYVNKEGDDRLLEGALLVKEGKSATIIYIKGDFSLKKIGGIANILSSGFLQGIKVDGEHVFYHHHCDKH